MNAAAMARQSKERNPEHYCAYPPCLWRVVNGRTGEQTPCPKHTSSNAAATPTVEVEA